MIHLDNRNVNILIFINYILTHEACRDSEPIKLKIFIHII